MNGIASPSGHGAARWLGVARWLLLLAPFVFTWFYPRLRAHAVFRWGPVSMFFTAVAVMAIYAALWLLVARAERRRGLGSATDGPGVQGRLAWLLAVAVGALFCWSAARYVEFFPPNIDGEAFDALRSANGLIQSLSTDQWRFDVLHRFRTYNVGLIPIVLPVAAYFGPDPLTYKWVNIAYFAVVLGALAVVFARLNLPRERWWLLLLLPLLTILLPSLQMYRWHCLCLAGSLALIQAAGAFHGASRRFYGSLVLFALLLTLYHGQMIYQAGLLGLAVWHLLAPEEGRPRRWDRVAGLVACAAICWILYAYLGRWAIFQGSNRGVEEARLLHRLLERDRAQMVSYSLLEAPERFLAWPIFALLLVGVAVTLERAGSRPADRMALLLGGAGFAVHALCLPIVNPSCRCWYLLPFLWFGLNGLRAAADALGRFLGARLGTAAAALGLIALGWYECPQYERRGLEGTLDSPAAQWNTSHQLDYLFRHLARVEPEPQPTLHAVPGQSFVSAEGGFTRQLEFAQMDWRRARVEIREIESAAEMRSLLEATLAGRLRHREVVLYLSQLGDRREWNPEAVQPILRGLPYEYYVLELQGKPLRDPMRCFVVRIRARPV